MTSKDILYLLLKRHNGDNQGRREWACFPEFMISPSSPYGQLSDMSERRIDLFAMNMFRCKKFIRIAYEIKVSRADFFSEIKNPQKREPIMRFCNQFWFATPKGLISPTEVPQGIGLMEFTEGSVYPDFIVKAETREDTIPPGWPLIASICRRVAKLEAKSLTEGKGEK